VRTSQQCPKCQSRQLFVIDPVRLPDRDGHLVTSPIHCGMIGFGQIEVGQLEAWICAKCEYLEYYAKAARKDLEALAKRPASGVRYLDGEPPTGGPFR
jgi:predicted nucleic-acid-binding Zn-ribbon protein